MSTPTSKRVFLLGPSHHAYTRKCCLSTATAYDTPLGEAELPAWLTRHCLLACSIHCSRGRCCCNMLGQWWGQDMAAWWMGHGRVLTHAQVVSMLGSIMLPFLLISRVPCLPGCLPAACRVAACGSGGVCRAAGHRRI